MRERLVSHDNLEVTQAQQSHGLVREVAMPERRITHACGIETCDRDLLHMITLKAQLAHRARRVPPMEIAHQVPAQEMPEFAGFREA